jgi:Tfp pilus assembly protein PilV
MFYINTSPAHRQRGFTLVELLVIAPVTVLVITGLVAVLIGLVGDALMAQQRNAATYESRDGLDQLEQDIRLSSAILQTSGTMPAYQGSNIASSASTNTTAFTAHTTLDGTSGRALILSAYATTANPITTTRTLVYTNQPVNPCPNPYTTNNPLRYTIVYYVYANALWRRTVVPSTATCGGAVAWQKNSCALAAAANCPTNDRLVVSNISSVTISYYLETSNPYTKSSLAMTQPTDNPTSINITVNTSKNVAGSPIATTMTLYASRLNN